MKYPVDDYSILVGRERDSGEFVAIVREFPSLSWVSPTRSEAAAGLRHLLHDVLIDMRENGEGVPVPQGTPELSDLQPA